jgi:hypothetical protein
VITRTLYEQGLSAIAVNFTWFAVLYNFEKQACGKKFK